ncbi:MAG: response regulator transcription factor [Chloroflexi bacterium]|nr:response regulator transcription factor [Chloroflexota bacterium]
MIRVAIVDDHPIVREGTAALLAATPDVEIVTTGATLAEAKHLLDDDSLDVVLLDIRLGQDSGLAALDGRSRRRPAVVLLTAYDYPQYADAALRLGAAGFVQKTAPIAELADAIRKAAAGGLAFGVRPGAGPTFSGRELDVMRLVVDGRSNDEIGTVLGVASKTIETRLRGLFDRLGIASRTELATRAIREGWLDLPPHR